MAARLRVLRFSDAPALDLGLAALARSGVTARDLVFLALDPLGAVRVALPDVPGPADAADPIRRLKVGEKLALAFPEPGGFYHFDSVHRLRRGVFLWNGDRRLSQPGNAVDVAGAMSEFLRGQTRESVFFGCTPHPPGCWLFGPRGAEPLHDAGFVEAVPVSGGLLARRVMDHRLWQLRIGERLDDAQPVFSSPLGNVLVLERRAVRDRLVATCEGGLIEVDVSLFPWVMERARVVLPPGGMVPFAVVGRIEHVAFAVTAGRVAPWGLTEIGPAELVGAADGSLDALAEALAHARL